MSLSGHPWIGDTFGDHEISLLFSPDAELKRMLLIEASWTTALGELEGNAAAIDVANVIRALAVDPADFSDGFSRDGVVIPTLVEAIKSAVGSDRQDLVHRGLTSQDVIDTSFILALREVMALYLERLAQLDEIYAELQARFGDRRLTPLTRMQPALEASSEEMIAKWRQPISALLADIAAAVERLAIIQWGGPIGIRNHPQAAKLGMVFARKLGLSDPGYAWHTDRTPVMQALAVMARISIATGKLGEDIALLAAMGADHVELSGGKSSAMPHKNNPTDAEGLVALADLAAIQMSGLVRSARHEGFRSGQAWTLEQLLVPEMCVSVGAGVSLALRLVGKIKSIGRDVAT